MNGLANIALFDASATATQGDSTWTLIMTLGIYAVFGFAIYFFLFRPNSKRKKKEAEMRKNAQVGDQITTIGGIVGRIVAVRDENDAIIIETGSDRSKMLVKRWAVGSVDTVHEDE